MGMFGHIHLVGGRRAFGFDFTYIVCVFAYCGMLLVIAGFCSFLLVASCLLHLTCCISLVTFCFLCLPVASCLLYIAYCCLLHLTCYFFGASCFLLCVNCYCILLVAVAIAGIVSSLSK